MDQNQALARLRRQAGKAARWRNHRLQWKYIFVGEYRSIALGTCRHCGAEVHCNTRPLPNDIDIGGGAVAVNCTREA